MTGRSSTFIPVPAFDSELVAGHTPEHWVFHSACQAFYTQVPDALATALGAVSHGEARRRDLVTAFTRLLWLLAEGVKAKL